MQAKSLPLTSPWTGPIVVALCAALGPWLVADAPWTWGFCAVLFVAVGLPHGAVDHVTYHHALGQSAKTAPWRFVGPYLLGLGAFAGWLLWMPVPATWAFLALSSWHFGQSHLTGTSHTWLGRARGWAMGAVLIGTLLHAQRASSAEVMLFCMSGMETEPAFWAALQQPTRRNGGPCRSGYSTRTTWCWNTKSHWRSMDRGTCGFPRLCMATATCCPIRTIPNRSPAWGLSVRPEHATSMSIAHRVLTGRWPKGLWP